MLDITDQMDLADEINRALATPLGDPVDEDELLKELEGSQEVEVLPTVPNINPVPEGIKSEEVKNEEVKDDEESQLAALEASMM